MKFFEAIALGFVQFFGITEPTPAQTRVATAFVVALLFGGLTALVLFFFLALRVVIH